MAEVPHASYCVYVQTLASDNVHYIYHDTQYGFPLTDDNELFGRLVLEINQAGLSWDTILRKQTNFQNAYHQFDIQTVAKYGEDDITRLLADAGIIRNRLKIRAAIDNANVILEVQKEYGSFKAWLDTHTSLDRVGWTKLFKKTFRFTGGKIVNEFLMSTGYLPGAHTHECSVGKRLRGLNIERK